MNFIRSDIMLKLLTPNGVNKNSKMDKDNLINAYRLETTNCRNISEDVNNFVPSKGYQVVSTNLQHVYYSSKSDALSLRNLLTSWNLSDLYEFFEQQQLYVGVLKHLTEQMTRSILESSNFSLGIQAEFYYNWSKWIKTVNQLEKRNEPQAYQSSKSQQSINSESSSNLQSNGNSINTPRNKFVIETGGLKISEDINLNKILAYGPYGPGVLSHYKVHNSLDEKTRKLLVEAFLYYCIAMGVTVSKATCKSLALQIQDTFKGEVAEYYYVHRAGTPLGKLYNKFHNWKTSIRNTTDKTSEAKAKAKECKEVIIYEVTETEPIHIAALENENLDFEEKFMHWKNCVSTRLNFINKEYSAGIHRITELWPLYKEPKGYKLIDFDFGFIYGDKEVLDKIDDFMKLMISRVFPKTLKGNENLELLKILTENHKELHSNGVCAAVFHLLQTLLPNNKQKNMSDLSKPNKRKAYGNFTTKESQDAFIAVWETEDIYEKCYNVNSSVPPYISIIGTMLNPTAIFCNIENIMYKMHSLPKAIDICFKAYHLFSLECSPAARIMWQFINIQFYHIKNNTTYPTVHLLLKTIKDAKHTEQQME